MSEEVYEVPVELTIHGKVKIRAVDHKTALDVVKRMRIQRLRQFFKEDFAFKSLVGERSEVQGDLGQADGEEDNSDVPDSGRIQGDEEGLQ